MILFGLSIDVAFTFLGYLTPWISPGSSDAPTVVTEYYVPTPDFGEPVASKVLFQELVENSWGHDFVSDYAPPEGVDFDHVKFYLQFESYGRQFDRLAHIYLDGVEVWRPSTPEPGNLSAITSNFTKDVSFALPLLRSDRELTVQLYNIMNDIYTGPFNTTLVAYYYKTGDSAVQIQETSWYAEQPPTNIEALSPLLLSLPSDDEVPMTINQLSGDTVRAFLQVYASGNADEEFWYFKRSVDGGPTRLAEVYIDGRLAGYADPFPQIYTGGYEPRIWTPIMGLRSFDVPAYYIDITPFLPVLWEHDSSVSIRIVNGYNGKRMDNDWPVNVALLTWEEPGAQGSGATHQTYRKDDPQIINLPATQIVQIKHILRNSANLTLHGESYYVEAKQTINHSSVNQEENVLAFNVKGSSFSQFTNLGDQSLSELHTFAYDYALAITMDKKEITIAQAYKTSTETPTGETYKVVAGHNGTWGGAKNEAGVCLGAYIDDEVRFGHSLDAVDRVIVSETSQTCNDWEHVELKSSSDGVYVAEDGDFYHRSP